MPVYSLRQTATRLVTSRFIITSNIAITGRTYTTATSEGPTRNDSLLTALQRANTILPNVLSPSESSGWTKLIDSSINLLSGPGVRKPRVAVWGSDENSHSTELVSALLDDPLVSDQRHVDALRNRRKGCTDSVLTIRYGELEVSTTILSLSLSWLQKLEVDVIEIPTAHPDFKTLLYDADVRIICVDALSAPLPNGLESLLLNPGTFIVIRYPSLDHQAVDMVLRRLLVSSTALSTIAKNGVLTVYPPFALSALDNFRQASNSATAIQAFQIDFLNSGMAKLSQAISQNVSPDKRDRKLCHGKLVLSGALETCRYAIRNASRDAATVQGHIEALHSRVNEAYARGVTDVLGGEDAPEVKSAVQRSTKEMQTTMNALKWWKLPFKVDDLGDILSRAVGRAWCRDLEAKVQFQTGRLSALRSSLSSETYASVGHLPPSYLSAVLVNTLQQTATHPLDLSPTTLTYPLTYRLQQLQHPIISLHRRAQRALLLTVTTAFASASSSYYVWLLGWITPATAVGLGALGIMGGMRWFVGNWEKGKKRWWADWHRVGEGLERDLRDTLAMVINGKVTAVPNTAAKELSKVLVARLSEIKTMGAKIESLEESSRSLYP